MKRQLLAAGLTAAAALTSGVVGLTPGTASAELGFEDITGNFTGDARDEILWYVAGIEPDPMMTLAYTGDPEFPYVPDQFHRFGVDGTYDPVVGNFDGDAYDEILWYAPGAGADSIWNFTSFTSVQSSPRTISGTYTPVAGDFNGDGIDDIIWYRPGTGQDYLWQFNSSGGYTSTAQRIDGTYTPIAGSFGTNATDDVLWYRPGTGADFLWDYNVGSTTYTSSPQTISGRFQPIVLDRYNQGWGSEDIMWYAAGSAADFQWNFVDGSYTSTPETVNSTYFSVISGDFLGDGFDDIVWYGFERESLWDHQPPSGGRRISTYEYGSLAATTAAEAGIPRRP